MFYCIDGQQNNLAGRGERAASNNVKGKLGSLRVDLHLSKLVFQRFDCYKHNRVIFIS